MEREVVDDVERSCTKPSEQLVVVECGLVGDEGGNANWVPKLVWQGQLGELLEAGSGREYRKLCEEAACRFVYGRCEVAIEPVEKVACKRCKVQAVGVLQHPRGAGDVQRGARVPEAGAVLLDRVNVGNEETVDQ